MRLRRLPEAPFLIDSLPYRRSEHRWLLSVVCKATYVLQAERSAFAPRPVDIFPEEQYVDGSNTLYAPRDLLPSKARPEVVAFHPASDSARMSFDSTSIPLYPLARKTNGHALKSLVQLTSEPLGDFDAERFQFAAREQWIDELPIGSSFTLAHALAHHDRLTTSLPSARPVLRVEEAGASRVVPLQADSLWIDLGRGLCTVTWRGTMEHRFDGDRMLELGVHDGRRAQWPAPSNSVGALPQNGQSQSIRVSPRPRNGSETFPIIDLEDLVTERTSPGHARPSDGQPKWLERRPLPPPSSPPPRRRTTPSHPTPSVWAKAPSSVPPPSPSPSSPASSAETSPPEIPTPSPYTAGLTTPARVSESPSPSRHPPVHPPNPALGLIQARTVALAPCAAIAAAPAEQPAAEPPAAALALDLLWRAPDCIARMEHHRDLERFVPQPPAPLPPAPILGAIEPDAPPPPAAAPDELITKALRLSGATHLDELRSLMLLHARDEASADVVLVMLEGELELSQDQRTALRIMADTARPLADDKSRELQVAVAHVDKVIDTPLAEDEGIVKGLTERLLRAWEIRARELPKSFLAEHTRRLLLRKRHHRKQRVLGQDCVRAFLRRGGLEIPVYLPPDAEARLPLMVGFPVRLLATIVPRQDEDEAAEVALLPLALARSIDASTER